MLEPARKLAVVTGVNLDGAQLQDLDRGDDWHLDPRVPPEEQCGPEVYAHNDLDRGHLTRRRDPVWGDPATAAQANVDSFSYVNAAPQAALFNQGEFLWAGLEDYVLDQARTYRQRLSVFTAPVLAADDPPYRGIQIPRRFWKIAARTTAPEETSVEGAEPAEPQPAEPGLVLAATGYLLNQSAQLDLIDLTDRATLDAGSPPALGGYLTYQVPIVDIATITGLSLGPLPTVDRLPAPAETVSVPDRWLQLHTLNDITL